jgi:RpiB/LacA/LacB family sugar-phosphate isomerase
MKVSIGSDHAGYDLKDYLLSELTKSGFEMIDCGPSDNASVDYPDFAQKTCGKVVDEEVEFGIVICSTGIGISIAANKIDGIRAALCHTESSALMARQHNNANVLALGGNVIEKTLAKSIAETFLKEKFSTDERHHRRVDKISAMEKKNTRK